MVKKNKNNRKSKIIGVLFTPDVVCYALLCFAFLLQCVSKKFIYNMPYSDLKILQGFCLGIDWKIN